MKDDGTMLVLKPGVNIEFVHVPAGEFLMGSADSDEYAESDERPQHTLYLEQYLIGKYDVTNAQFRAFVQATGYRTIAEQQDSGGVFDGSKWKVVAGANWQNPRGSASDINDRDDFPVVQVSWHDAVAFCEWVSRVSGRKVTLPTEAQWEKAARGPDGRIYPWGNQTPDSNRLNFNMNVMDVTEAGRYSPLGDSPSGAADMAGNVYQWVADWHEDAYYSQSPGSNPLGPASGTARVMRGGAFNYQSDGVRCACRYRLIPDSRYGSLGFRVAASRI